MESNTQGKGVPLNSLISTVWQLILTSQIIKHLLSRHKALVSALSTKPDCEDTCRKATEK